MKKSTTFIVFLIVATIYAGASVSYFHVRSEGDNIKLEWQTSSESNLQNFVIERKTPQSTFIEVGSVSPKGGSSVYSYVDQNTYKTNDVIFIYRLKLVDNDGSVSYSYETTVSHSVSSVKRTWGSIKAMFR